MRQAVAAAGSGPLTLLRPLSLESSRRVGNVRLVRADTDNPLHLPLKQLVLASYGAPAVIADEFGAIKGIEHLYLFGSWAARYAGQPGSAPRDIGSPTITRDDADDCLQTAAAILDASRGLLDSGALHDP